MNQQVMPVKNKSARRQIWGFNPNVFFLGIVSLLTDISSEMIFTLIPLFLANVLGAGTGIIGIIGGITESVDAILRIFSGWFSDRLGKRKLLTVLGYSISTLVKPFMYFATGWGTVLGVRFGDRVGKGIRSSARDALIANSIAPNERGKSFGFHRMMDTSGAVIGLAAAALIIYLLEGSNLELTRRAYQWVVIFGVVPAVIAVLVLYWAVNEQKPGKPGLAKIPLLAGWSGLDKRFKLFLLVVGLFTLGNSSDFFVILRAQNLDVPLVQVLLMLVLFNITYAAISLPAGVVSDHLGRKRVISLGWLIYAIVYLGFAWASQIWQAWVLFAVYGIYYGMTEGVAKALVADLVIPEKRGTAYGLYQGVVGLALLPASVIAGWLWQLISPEAVFYFGGALALSAALALLFFIRKPDQSVN